MPQPSPHRPGADMPRVLVAGGGVAGLAAAWTLHRAGADVELVEIAPRLGGKLNTERCGDLLIDTGPDSFLSSKPAAVRLATELGIADQIINTRKDGGGTFILRRGKLQPLPEGITLLVPASFRAIARSPLLSPLGKARMALDYVIPARKGNDDESVGAFVRRRLGREAFERLAEPLLSGIYAGDADALSLACTFPRLREVERTHGGMVRGALAQRRATTGNTPSSSSRTPFVSFAGGMSTLIDALACAIGPQRTRTGLGVVALDRSPNGWRATLSDDSCVSADGVILAVPAFASAELLAPHAPDLSAALREIPWVSTATISLAFPRAALPDGLSGRGFVVPRAERRVLTAVTWTSQKFPGRAPDDIALLRGFVGRAGNEEPAALPEDTLVDLVCTELREILGIRATPTFARVYRWPRALPQYTLGHTERL
ncbi:MAG: protoporphyrinogen oxidase, partial [Chloroflexi bacterium]